MTITFIAFIECTLDNHWETRFGYPFDQKKSMWSQYKSLNDDSEIRLVDIKNDRRYFSFKRDAIVQLVNNVISFNSDESDELAIDESKNFPKPKTMTD